MKNQRTQIRYYIFLAFSSMIFITCCSIFHSMYTENIIVSKSNSISNHNDQHILYLKNEAIEKIDTIDVSQPKPQKQIQIDCDESSTFTSIFGKLMLAFLGGILLSDGLFIRIGAI